MPDVDGNGLPQLAPGPTPEARVHGVPAQIYDDGDHRSAGHMTMTSAIHHTSVPDMLRQLPVTLRLDNHSVAPTGVLAGFMEWVNFRPMGATDPAATLVDCWNAGSSPAWAFMTGSYNGNTGSLAATMPGSSPAPVF